MTTKHIEQNAIQWLQNKIQDKDFVCSNIKRTSYSSLFEYQEYDISYIFKINLLNLNYEPQITQYLHNLFPKNLLQIHKFSSANRCFSSKKINAMESHVYFKNSNDKDLLLKIISKFCEIQNKVSVQSLNHLKIRNLSFENLIINFTNATKGTFYEKFNNEFLNYKECIQEDINKLSNLGIQNSIEHGDFHLGNILIAPDKNFIFIDFAEATISNPFFSLISFIFSLQRKLSMDINDAFIGQIKNTYFEKYSLLNNIYIDDVIKSYEISERLFDIYYLITILEIIKLETNSKKYQERFQIHFQKVIFSYKKL